MTPDITNLTIGQSYTLRCPSNWADRFTFYQGQKVIQSGGKDSFTIDKFDPVSHAGTYTCLVENSTDAQAKALSGEVVLKYGEIFSPSLFLSLVRIMIITLSRFLHP